MAANELLRIELRSGLDCQPGTTTLATIEYQAGDEVSVEYALGVAESGLVLIETDEPAMAAVAPRRVAALVHDDGAGGEWREEMRVAGVARDEQPDFGVAEVSLVGILLDLADAGRVYDPSLPVRVFAGHMLDATIAEVFDAVLFGVLARGGVDYITLDVDPALAAIRYDWVWSSDTTLSLLARTLGAKGEGQAEFQLVRNGTVDWTLRIQPKVAADLAPATVAIDDNLRRHGQGWEAADLATRVVVDGLDGESLDQNVFHVAAIGAVVGGTQTITLTDPEGKAVPVTRAGQLVDRYLHSLRTGLTYLVTATATTPTPASGDVTVSGVSTGALVVGDRIEIVESVTADTTYDADRLVPMPARIWNATLGAHNTARGLDFTLAAPSGETVQAAVDTGYVWSLANYSPTATTLSQALATDESPVGHRAAIYRDHATEVYANDPDGSDGAGDQTTLTWVSDTTLRLSRQLVTGTVDGAPIWTASTRALPVGTAVGDVLAIRDVTRNQVWVAEITALADADFTIAAAVAGQDATTWMTSMHTSVTTGLKVLRRQAGVYPRVEAFDEATNTLTLDDASGVLAGDRLRFVAPPGPATYLSELIDTYAETPAPDGLGYGVKAGAVALPDQTGARNILGDGHWRASEWVGNAPTEWTVTVQSGSATKSTDPDHTRYGGAALKLDPGTVVTLTSPTRRHFQRPGMHNVSLRVAYEFTGAQADYPNDASISLRVIDMTRRGDGSTANVVGTYTIPRENVIFGAPADVALNGVALPATCRDLAVQIIVNTGPAGQGRTAYLDGCHLTDRTNAPSGLIDHSGSNVMWATAAPILAERSDPQSNASSYTVDVEADPDAPIVVGQTVHLTDGRGLVALPLRVVRLRVSKTYPDRLSLTLAREAPVFSYAGRGTGSESTRVVVASGSTTSGSADPDGESTPPTSSTGIDPRFSRTQPPVVLDGFTPLPVPDPAVVTLAFTHPGGTAIIGDKVVTLPAKSFTLSEAGDYVIIADSEQAELTIKALLDTDGLRVPLATELFLTNVYATTALGIYRIYNRATRLDDGVRGPADYLNRIELSTLPSGTTPGGAYDGAVRLDPVGYVNWYFANLGLLPFVEELPTIVQGHLDKQIALFYDATTGTGATDWAALHGTTHVTGANGYYAWPYDVIAESADPLWDARDFYSSLATVSKRRADSHDSYAATFILLAVRYARTASGGIAWWDANYASIWRAAYYNILIRLVPVPDGTTPSGYLTQTFQDNAVYPWAQTMDNVEVWAALRAMFALMDERGAAGQTQQATDHTAYSGTEADVLNGLRWLWRDDVTNTAGVSGWWSVRADISSSPVVRATNNLASWYPDLTVHAFVGLWGVPLSSDKSLARTRLAQAQAHLARATFYWKTRNYDLFPWPETLVAAARIGARDVAAEGLSFIQRSHIRDEVYEFVYTNHLGWMYTAARVLAGTDIIGELVPR